MCSLCRQVSAKPPPTVIFAKYPEFQPLFLDFAIVSLNLQKHAMAAWHLTRRGKVLSAFQSRNAFVKDHFTMLTDSVRAKYNLTVTHPCSRCAHCHTSPISQLLYRCKKCKATFCSSCASSPSRRHDVGCSHDVMDEEEPPTKCPIMALLEIFDGVISFFETEIITKRANLQISFSRKHSTSNRNHYTVELLLNSASQKRSASLNLMAHIFEDGHVGSATLSGVNALNIILLGDSNLSWCTCVQSQSVVLPYLHSACDLQLLQVGELDVDARTWNTASPINCFMLRLECGLLKETPGHLSAMHRYWQLSITASHPHVSFAYQNWWRHSNEKRPY